MKRWQWLFTCFSMSSAIIIAGVLLGGEQFTHDVGRIGEIIAQALLAIVLLGGLIICGPYVAGRFIGGQLVPKLDDAVEPSEKIGGLGQFFLALSSSLLLGLVLGLWLVPTIATNQSLWVYGIFRALGWNGIYETKPILWVGYGWIVGMCGYYDLVV